VDQLCIHQEDLQEKQTQVQLMALIYRRAYSTVIWLGESPDQGAFELLRGTASKLQYANTSSQELTEQEFEDSLEYLGCSSGKARDDLASFFNRPWFQRVWIIQEAALSHNAHVMCGESTMSWEELSFACRVVKDSEILPWLERREGFSSCNSEISCNVVVDIDSMQIQTIQSVASGTYGTLLEHLVMTRTAQATDPRDKVYGILAMGEPPIIPDYTKGANVIFREVTTLYLKESIEWVEERRRKGDLDLTVSLHDIFRVFSCLDFDHSRLQPSSLSWVPDWSKEPGVVPLGFGTSVTGYYRAGRGVQTDQPVVLNADGLSLTMSCVIFDKISHISEDLTAWSQLSNEDLQSNKVLADLAHFLLYSLGSISEKHQDFKASSKATFTSFWKTLVAGKDYSGRNACPTEYAEIFSFLLDLSTGKKPSLFEQTYTRRQESGRMTLSSLQQRTLGRTFKDVRKAFSNAASGRRMCVTEKGFVGLIPRISTPGDIVVVFPGAAVPFVLRTAAPFVPRAVESHDLEMWMVGECYVHGIMDGEAGKMDEVEIGSVRIV
jgi:hypothetical protein